MAAYVASISGIFKSYGTLPPYGYDANHRPWFERGSREDGLVITVHKNVDDNQTAVALTKRVVKRDEAKNVIERKFVVGVDINWHLFHRLANKTCNQARKNVPENLTVCAIYTQQGHLVYHDKIPKNETSWEHTIANTERQVVEAEIKRGINT